jgi:anti-sigma factor RsiW
MNHPTENELLLLGYGELPGPRAAELDAHVAGCSVCHERLTQLERARVALHVALPERRPSVVAWAALGALAAAAAIAGVLLIRTVPTGGAAAHGWNPTTVWSATAGYVAGGNAMVDIDAQLTRLEQERSYGLPN